MGQEYGMFEAEGELIRALLFNPALTATATAHRLPDPVQRSTLSILSVRI